MKYLVSEGGKTTEHEMSPNMETAWKGLKAFFDKHGCKCGEDRDSSKDIVMPRGHSVDVSCGVCGGIIQIG